MAAPWCVFHGAALPAPIMRSVLISCIGMLRFRFAQASSVYHSSGEDQSHWSLIVDQTFAYVTFAHTILRTAMQLHRTSVPGLCGLIATALLVYSVAVPLRGHHNGARGPYTTVE